MEGERFDGVSQDPAALSIGKLDPNMPPTIARIARASSGHTSFSFGKHGLKLMCLGSKADNFRRWKYDIRRMELSEPIRHSVLVAYTNIAITSCNPNPAFK
jgi:hypothetical protein